jgi:hypothetical protein
VPFDCSAALLARNFERPAEPRGRQELHPVEHAGSPAAPLRDAELLRLQVDGLHAAYWSDQFCECHREVAGPAVSLSNSADTIRLLEPHL